MSDYINVFKKYAEFRGRARRREYWMFTLFNTLISAVVFTGLFITGLSGVLLAGSGTVAGAEPLYFVSLAILWIYALALLIPSLAVTVRRLHDAGYSAWNLLIVLIPGVGSIILFVFTVKDSNPGDNQYGVNPKQVADV